MRSDEASEIDDNRPDVGHPHDVLVTLRLQQRVEQADVLVGKRLGRRDLGAVSREDSQAADPKPIPPSGPWRSERIQ